MTTNKAQSVQDILNKSKDKILGTRPTDERVVEVPLERLKPNPFQPRKAMTPSQIEELAASIASEDLLQPIVVGEDPSEAGSYFIIAGHRRAAAFEHLQRTKIKAIVRPWEEDRADVQALIENQQRENLTPFEAAYAIANIMKRHSLKQKEMAERLGMSSTHVNRLVKLTALPERLASEFSQAPVSLAMLEEIGFLSNAEQQLRVWDSIKDGKITSSGQIRKLNEKKKVTTATENIEKITETDRIIGDLKRAVARVERKASDDSVLPPDKRDEIYEAYRRLSEALNTIGIKTEALTTPQNSEE